MGGQTEVFDATFLSFFRHIISGEGLRDWGACVGFLVTAGAVAAHSLEAWCTCMGIMSIGMGLFNLLPIPVLNGRHIFLCLVEIIDRGLVDRLRLPLAYGGMIFSLLGLLYLFLVDVRWIGSQVLNSL